MILHLIFISPWNNQFRNSKNFYSTKFNFQKEKKNNLQQQKHKQQQQQSLTQPPTMTIVKWLLLLQIQIPGCLPTTTSSSSINKNTFIIPKNDCTNFCTHSEKCFKCMKSFMTDASHHYNDVWTIESILNWLNTTDKPYCNV